MLEEELKDLLDRYKAGKASDAEKALLESWYLKLEPVEEPDYELADRVEDANAVWSNLEKEGNKQRKIVLWRSVTAAAVVLLVCSFFLYFYTGQGKVSDRKNTATGVQSEIVAGGNNAVLTLADGRKISLNDVKKGELARESGIVVSKNDDGKLVYTISNADNAVESTGYNTIETPNGGQYHLQLPDGTEVWLNAASSLKYPASFIAKAERKVELRGEAYFEVSKDKSRPFRVVTAAQTVEVLGTHFNVSAYADERKTKTTLVEGLVKVSGQNGQETLQPGQQAILEQNTLSVKNADVNEIMAWKNGYFQFNDEQAEDILLKLARWYDVEFQYVGHKTNEGFTGVISRSKSIHQVLKMLEKTKAIRFKIEGRRVLVM